MLATFLLVFLMFRCMILRANAGKNQKSGYMGVFKNIFFGDLYWSTTEWTLNPKYYPEISSGLDFAALGSSDFSKNDFFQKIKEKTTVTWFFNQISWFLEVLQVLAWIFEKKIIKKNLGPKFARSHQLFMFLLSSEMATCRAQDQNFWGILYTVGKIMKSSIH